MLSSAAFVSTTPLRLGPSSSSSWLQRNRPSPQTATCNARSNRLAAPVLCSRSSLTSPVNTFEDNSTLTCSSQNLIVAKPPIRERLARLALSPSTRRCLTRIALTVLVSTIFHHVTPVLATAGAASSAIAASPFQAALKTFSESNFVSGLTASFLLVLASEIGDKTFFISALLSMKYSRVLVLVGTMLALGSMTVISVGIGQIFHALPTSLNTSIPFDDYAAVALLLWFGFQSIRDGLTMKQDDDDELQDAKDVLAGKPVQENSSSAVRVVGETSSLIFLAEWGDKSMLATVALAAAKSPLGVIVGGISGHFIASIIAVVGGSVLGKYISERSARLIGGVLFLVFAVLTILGIY